MKELIEAPGVLKVYQPVKGWYLITQYNHTVKTVSDSDCYTCITLMLFLNDLLIVVSASVLKTQRGWVTAVSFVVPICVTLVLHVFTERSDSDIKTAPVLCLKVILVFVIPISTKNWRFGMAADQTRASLFDKLGINSLLFLQVATLMGWWKRSCLSLLDAGRILMLREDVTGKNWKWRKAACLAFSKSTEDPKPIEGFSCCRHVRSGARWCC